MTPHYQPEVDGLRAVAIAAVFLFHLNPAWLPGGFAGVDVFFVISGYLITGLVFASNADGTFSFAGFYQRRIARIFPAFALVLVAVLAAAGMIFVDRDVASVGANAAAAALSVINLKLILQGSYFTLSRDAQPLLHYWSLAVEEQFYLVFVPVFVFLFRRFKRAAAPVLLALAVLSFLACIILTEFWQSAAFYLLPTRAWELLAGSVAAISASRIRQSFAPTGGWPALAGAALVLGSFVWLWEASFPGYLAAVPVAGTVLLVLFAGSGGSLLRGLSAAPTVLVGKLSYSLYLWHWPVFSFVDYRLLTASDGTRLLVKVAASLALAAATYFAFERPMRTLLNRRGSRKAAYAVFVAGTLVIALTGWAVRNELYLDATASRVASGGIAIDNGGVRTMALAGDSNGSMYARAVKAVAAGEGFNLNVLSSAGHDPLPDGDLWEATISFLDAAHPDVVVLVCHWETALAHDPDRLSRALDAVRQATKAVVLITQPPALPKEATREAIRNGARAPFYEPTAARERRERANALVRDLAGPGIAVVDIEDLFFEESGGVRTQDGEGNALYADEGHLSGAGAALVGGRLEAAIAGLLPAAQ